MKKNGLNGYITNDILNVSVENLGELKELIDDIKEKEKALQEAVQKLSRFDLKIKFY